MHSSLGSVSLRRRFN